MLQSLWLKIKESAMAVLPLSIVVIIFSLLYGISSTLIGYFAVGSVMLIIGLALFSLGAEGSMMTIALEAGNNLVKSKRIWLITIILFILGFLITVAEPALWVLADQFKDVISEPLILIMTVSVGTGIFVVIALLRIIFQFKLRTLIIIGYGLVFGLAITIQLINPEFLPVAFDSGGVTTGPMAVPFIMALGQGFAKARGDQDADIDSFGLIGIASIGPIIAVLFLGLLYQQPTFGDIDTTTTMFEYFLSNIVQMAIAISPFIAVFIVFQLFAFKFSRKKVIKTTVSFVYVYLGLIIFLTGANGGLVNLAYDLGSKIVSSDATKWLLIPIGMIFGYIAIAAEPSVIVLNKLVEDVSAGTVSKKMMMVSLSIGVSVAVGLAELRVLTGIPIWMILLPIYLLIIGLTFVTPKIFYSIAFDSGGAVSGALTSAFLVPLTIGAGKLLGANLLTDAFGLVAFVAMTPLLTIQVLGLLYKYKQRQEASRVVHDEVIHFEGGDGL
jgi:hypothetical protein